MANYYRILSAFSASGDDLFIPVPWNFDDISDISVVVAGTNGFPSICNYWKWNSQLHQVEIENTQNFSQWYAYVSRKEDASTLLQLVEGFVVNPQNIVEQFQKINRLIESLQEDSKTSLRSPDYIDALIPNANGRKNSFLSFDENGNPSCNIPVETFQDAVGFMEEAVANAEDSFDEFVSQKTSEFNSNAASKKEEINTLAAQAETSKNAAITAANGATAAAQAAEASKEEAAASKTSAEESATEAQGFAQVAATAQAAAAQSATNAQASATAAAESATQAQTSATNAQAAATQAQAAATQAQTSKSNAAASATQAQGSAQAAQASQTAAAHSATNAQASATAAAGSATQAQTSATNAQVAQAAAENAAQIAQATDAGKLALDKLPYGTLYFSKGKLSGSNFAIPNFPFSICATVRIDEWQSDSFTQTIFQYGDYGSSTDPWCSLAFMDTSSNPQLRVTMLLLIDGAQKTTQINCAVNLSEFLGKTHTIIGICRAVTAEALNWDIYVDGVKQNIASSSKDVIVDSLSGTRNWAVNTSNYSYSNNPASANPMMLRNLYVFNFDISAEGSPYSIADYVAGRLIPPSLIGNQFTGMYGSGWSVSGDTATCSGSSNTTFLNISRGVVPSGFNFSFTLDVELSFSGTALFEVYTNCQKAHAEIYDYSTGLTTKKDSANGGGFYGNSSLGITSSGHYRIKFDCESSLGGGGARQIACGALSSGTIILSNTYYTRCNLALENYTIARNATTTLVKDASGNSNDATVTGNVAGDNDQSIKVFVDEIKTQINQSNG